ncbi:hypothetical protein ACIPC1_34925 [Streptomyces sp. NPDC087263]|uniref:hypothetical protein n=1 Tax=Streptomyces sp. NPDC087263 TaxID=3365773 RepID=UPI0037F78127
MTARPPVRMCARCQCTTDEPVLVHEVHAATGPGFNVYACPDCADHYPPMTDPLELLEAEAPRPSRMTMRVYKVTPEGSVVETHGEIHTWTGSRIDPAPQTSAFPPCGCPGCRARP